MSRPRVQSANLNQHVPHSIVTELSLLAEGQKVTPSPTSRGSRNRSRSAYLDSSVASHASQASGDSARSRQRRNDRPVSARPPSSHFLRSAVQRPSTTDPSAQIRTGARAESGGHSKDEWEGGLGEWSINSDKTRDQKPLESPRDEEKAKTKSVIQGRLPSAPRQRHPAVPLLNFRGQPSKHANGYVSPDVLDEYKNSLSETTVAKLITEMPTRRDEEEDEMTEKEDSYRWYRKSGWRSQRVKKFASPLDSRDFLKPRHRTTGSVHPLLAAADAPLSPKEAAPSTWLFSQSDARSQPLVRYRSKIWTIRPASVVQVYSTPDANSPGQSQERLIRGIGALREPQQASHRDEGGSESEGGAEPLRMSVRTRGGGGGGWWRKDSRDQAASDHGLAWPAARQGRGGARKRGDGTRGVREDGSVQAEDGNRERGEAALRDATKLLMQGRLNTTNTWRAKLGRPPQSSSYGVFVAW